MYTLNSIPHFTGQLVQLNLQLTNTVQLAGNCMRPNPSEEIFAVFIFVDLKRDALTTPLPDDGHAPLGQVQLTEICDSD